MAYGSNKVATAVLMDVSRGMDMMSSDGRTHFDRSKRIVSRIILRKMFAYETDEMGIITFGPDGVRVVADLKIPTWDTYEKTEELLLASAPAAGNWAKGLIQAVNFLEEQCQGKKFKTKQLIVFSNFTWSSPSVHVKLEPLIDVVNGNKLQVLVIGLDIKQESQTQNEVPAGVGELMEFVDKLNTGMMLSFEEIEDDVKYYAKKKKAKRLSKSSMKIGEEISLPFKWMKVNNDDVRLKYEVPPRRTQLKQNGEDPSNNAIVRAMKLGFTLLHNKEFAKQTVLTVRFPIRYWNGDRESVKFSSDPSKLTILIRPAKSVPTSVVAQTDKRRLEPDDGEVPSKKIKADVSVVPGDADTTAKYANIELKFAQDESRKTRFGATEVLLSYADIEAMKMKTGPPSMTFLGTVKSSKISRAMIVSPQVYVIVSDGSKRSQAQLSALITALLNANKYGLARRIASVNGRPKIGILYPVSDDLGKALYFLQLPLADWVNAVPFRPLPDVVEPALDGLMDQLIDAMSIEERGKDILPKDPNFQLRSFRAELKATMPQERDQLPELVHRLLHPHPEKEAAGEAIVKKILTAFDIPPPPPPPVESKTKVEESKSASPSKTPKKELTEAEKKEIKAIEGMVLEDSEDMAVEWEKYRQEKYGKNTQPEMNTEEVMKMFSPL